MSESDTSDKRELLEAFDKVVHREHERTVETASAPLARRTGGGVTVLCVLAWGTLAYAWLAKPAWLFPPDPTALVTPWEQEAAIRFGIYLERERVLEYLRDHGRLPASLAEAGDVEEGVDYVVSGDSSFVVTGEFGGTQLHLNENESADALLRGTGVRAAGPPQ